MAKCLDMLRTTNRLHLGIQKSLALWYISHIGGGEHPPKVTVLRMTLCEACQSRHDRDAKGQKQQL